MAAVRTILAIFFCSCAVLLTSGCASDSDRQLKAMQEAKPAIDEDRRELREERNARAEYVPGWNVGGADRNADLRAMGADKYYFANRSGYGVSVTILTDRPIEDFTPKGWRLLASDGSPAAGPSEPWINFIHLLSARYVLAATGRSVRNGDVTCGTDGGELRLFEIPGVRLAKDEPKREWMILMFSQMLRLTEEEDDICSRYDGDRVRGYARRDFLPDGREPEPSDNPTHTLIVPACPIETILRPAPKISPEDLRRPGFRFPPWTEAPQPRSC